VHKVTKKNADTQIYGKNFTIFKKIIVKIPLFAEKIVIIINQKRGGMDF